MAKITHISKMESNKWLKSCRGKSYKSSEGKTAAR